MLKPRSFGKVLVGTALLLPSGMLAQTAVAQAQQGTGSAALVSYSRDDGADGSDELWTPSSHPDESSSGSSGRQYEEVGPARSLEDLRQRNHSGGGVDEDGLSAKPDDGLVDAVAQFTKSIVRSVVNVVEPEGGPFNDSKDYWFKLYYDQAMSAASQAVDQVGQTAQNTVGALTGNQPAAAESAPVQPAPAPRASAPDPGPVMPAPQAGPSITDQQPQYNPSPPAGGGGRRGPAPGVGEADDKPHDGSGGPKGPQGGGGPR